MLTTRNLASNDLLRCDSVFRRFVELVVQSQSQVRPLDPAKLKKRFSRDRKNLMAGYGQQDAFEFCMHLLDAIETDIGLFVHYA